MRKFFFFFFFLTEKIFKIEYISNFYLSYFRCEGGTTIVRTAAEGKTDGINAQQSVVNKFNSERCILVEHLFQIKNNLISVMKKWPR